MRKLSCFVLEKACLSGFVKKPYIFIDIYGIKSSKRADYKFDPYSKEVIGQQKMSRNMKTGDKNDKNFSKHLRQKLKPNFQAYKEEEY